jgi:hypothetical protein
MSKDMKLVRNPEIIVEKRPGPNYFKTPLSEYRMWTTSVFKQHYGNIWFNNSKKAATAEVTENVFNNRLINKHLYDVAAGFERNNLEFNPADRFHRYVKEQNKPSSYYDSVQHIDKIFINSLYGALGSEYFHLFKVENAIDITLSGQHLIKTLSNAFDNYFRNDFWKDKRYFEDENPANGLSDAEGVVKIIETDSVAEGTYIDVNGKQTKIEEVFLLCDKVYNKFTKTYGTWNNIERPTTNSYNTETNEIETDHINYVMRHKSEKEMFRLEWEGGYVDVTDDHSIMIKRDGSVIEVTIKDIKDTDELIIS